MVDVLSYFVVGGIYKLKGTNKEYLFLCTPSAVNVLGKLVQFKLDGKLYKRTNIQYLLSSYEEGDTRSIFLNRDNYDMVGKLENNYCLSDDEQYLIGAEK